jgi:hypothetical protein
MLGLGLSKALALLRIDGTRIFKFLQAAEQIWKLLVSIPLIQTAQAPGGNSRQAQKVGCGCTVDSQGAACDGARIL